MKNQNALSLLTGLLFLFFISCDSVPTVPTLDTEQVKKEITANSQIWAKAINEKDVESRLAIFADDFQLFEPNQPPTIGKAAMKVALEEAIAKDTTARTWTIAFTTNDVFAGGDYATEIGDWTVTSTEGAVLDKGNFITVSKKTGDKYLVVRDIYNSEMPLPTGDDAPEE